MISKKEFLQAIKTIQDYNIKLDAIRTISPNLSLGIGCLIDRVHDTYVRLLELDCELDPDIEYGTEISWWVYETDFGRKKDMNKIYIGKKAYPINTAEDLYKFIVSNKKRKKK